MKETNACSLFHNKSHIFRHFPFLNYLIKGISQCNKASFLMQVLFVWISSVLIFILATADVTSKCFKKFSFRCKVSNLFDISTLYLHKTTRIDFFEVLFFFPFFFFILFTGIKAIRATQRSKMEFRVRAAEYLHMDLVLFFEVQKNLDG